MKICGVYKITNPLGKVYIGSANNLKRRESEYKSQHCKSQIKLYNSIKKYGWEAHTFEVIAITAPEDRLKWEHILGIYYNVLCKEKGLNLKLPSYDDTPAIVSDEFREKMREIRLGTKVSPEGRRNMAVAQQNKTPETKDKIRQSKLGKKHTPEARKNMSIAQQNMTQETKDKMRKSHLGLKHSPESIEKTAAPQRKPVIDTVTGIIYPSLRNAALENNLSIPYLCIMLSGKQRNKTNLLYLNKFNIAV